MLRFIQLLMLAIVTLVMCSSVLARHSEKAIRQAINNLDKYACTSLDGPDCSTSIEPEPLIDSKLQHLLQEKMLELLAQFGVETINDPTDGTDKLSNPSAIDVSFDESIMELTRADMDILKRALMRGEIEIDLEEYDTDLGDEEVELSEDELIELFNQHVASEQAIKQSTTDSNKDEIEKTSADEPVSNPSNDEAVPQSETSDQSIDADQSTKQAIKKDGDDDIIEID